MTTWTAATKASAPTWTATSPSLLTVDSYSEANIDGDTTNLRSDQWQQIGQTFTTTSAAALASCKFSLKKLGTPTGTMTAKLYAFTGGYGGSGKPTGAALATSGTVSVSSLTTSYQLITFTFPNPKLTVSASTHYAILLDANSVTGNASNYVLMGTDTIGPTQGGDYFFSSDSSTYTSSGTIASLAFYVYGFTAFTPTSKS